MTRQPFVAGNWKMNASRAEAASLLAEIVDGVSAGDAAQVLVCPPFVHIPAAGQQLAGSPVAWGAQNLDVHDSGAYTGEISGPMLRDFGCGYCIVGHSERRAMYGETSELVAEKCAAVQRADMTPIVCVGETREEREGGQTESVVAAQIDTVLDHIGSAALVRSIIAYEPVWAIGTGLTATPEQAQAVHHYLRQRIAARDSAVAEQVRILYGGSVKSDNAEALFAQQDIDGGLIGGASLDAKQFIAIVKAAG